MVRFDAATEALEGVPLVFFDGTTILLPESETAAIELLRVKFDAADDMIRGALDIPGATYSDWKAVYLASMEPH